MNARKNSNPEPALLAWAVLALLPAFAMVLLARHEVSGAWEPRFYLPLGGYVITVLVLGLALKLVRFRGDRVLLAAAVFLAGLGVVAQVRLGTLDVTAQLRWAHYAVPAGWALMLVVLVVFRGGRTRLLFAGFHPAALLAVLVLGALLAAGRRYRGGVFLEGNINPIEVVKVLLVIYLAGLFTVYRKAFERPLLPGVPALERGLVVSMTVCWLLPMGLLVVLRDLGLMVLLNAVLLVMAVLASGRWSYLVTGLLWVGGAGALLIHFMPHGSHRVEVWLNPFAIPPGAAGRCCRDYRPWPRAGGGAPGWARVIPPPFRLPPRILSTPRWLRSWVTWDVCWWWRSICCFSIAGSGWPTACASPLRRAWLPD
jgi:hypothetical protein